MIEEITKEIGDELEMFPTELQMAQRTIHSSGQRKDEDAYLPALRDLQDSDGMNDWLAIQWGILRDAGLLNE